jgi:hypothetical protein
MSAWHESCSPTQQFVPGGSAAAPGREPASQSGVPLRAPFLTIQPRAPEVQTVTDNVREHLERILSSYEDIDTRFSGVGGVGKLLGLFEDVKRELERVSEQELDRITGEIKNVVEALLKVDYELRKVQNLKLLFEQRKAHLSAADPPPEEQS